MQLDWFTLVAQLLNFALLLVLLRRFLFIPIQRAMREREEAIAARMQAAEVQLQQAREESERWRQQQQTFEAQRAELLTATEAEVAELRRQLVQAARAEVNEMQERWYASLEDEKSEFLHLLRQGMNKQIFAVARQALTDLADVDLERQICAIFRRRLQQLDVQERILLKQAVQNSNEPVLIRSAFELPDTERQQILALLGELIGETNNTQFRVAPELLCGIELQVYGQRIAWSLHHYLEEMEDHVATLLKTDTLTRIPSDLPDRFPMALKKGTEA